LGPNSCAGLFDLLQVRAVAIEVVGRLSVENPAYAMPSLRRYLMQLLSDMDNALDSRQVTVIDRSLPPCLSSPLTLRHAGRRLPAANTSQMRCLLAAHLDWCSHFARAGCEESGHTARVWPKPRTLSPQPYTLKP
jgi:hypothetical protein